jgi:hypothetical protein
VAIVKPAPKPEEAWHPARLIPTTGIGGAEEQEQRATSSLLAVMHAVPEFGRALLAHAGAPAGRITTFTEIHIKDLDAGTTSIPDAAIVVERGKLRWCALVEVKTGGNALRKEQVERYLDLARINSFDAVLTISNDITSDPAISPIAVDVRKTKKVALRHLPWFQVTTEAVLQHRHRKLSDPDQAWLLGELIAYLENEKSGAGGFEDMGDQWVTVRDEARARTLNATPRAPAMSHAGGSSSSSTSRWPSSRSSVAMSPWRGRRSSRRLPDSTRRFVGSLTKGVWQPPSGFPTRRLPSTSRSTSGPVKSRRAPSSRLLAKDARPRGSIGYYGN